MSLQRTKKKRKGVEGGLPGPGAGGVTGGQEGGPGGHRPAHYRPLNLSNRHKAQHAFVCFSLHGEGKPKLTLACVQT